MMRSEEDIAWERGKTQRGFTTIELVVAMIVLMAALVVVLLQVRGTGGNAHEAAMNNDIKVIGTAMDTFYLYGDGRYPTENGELPPEGEEALIDWHASFVDSGERRSFYPDFIKKLPRHWDEGVWRVDSSGLIVVDIDPNQY